MPQLGELEVGVAAIVAEAAAEVVHPARLVHALRDRGETIGGDPQERRR